MSNVVTAALLSKGTKGRRFCQLNIIHGLNCLSVPWPGIQ